MKSETTMEQFEEDVLEEEKDEGESVETAEEPESAEEEAAGEENPGQPKKSRELPREFLELKKKCVAAGREYNRLKKLVAEEKRKLECE